MVSKGLFYINSFVKYVLILFMVTIVISVFCQVLFRFVINQPLAWTEELSRYSLVWLTFLGAAYAASLKGHISIDFFVKKLPLILQKGVMIIVAIICFYFFYILMSEGMALARQSMTQLSPVLRLPMGYVYSVIPISGFLLTLNYIYHTYLFVIGKEEM
ncbi:TRAP transporter small permease [Bacillaceae bacterium IKA-2]|jgi:TRAP-type C4-dicarboxylate transport system permease small subunit|nr:TRAP transporter small permease [Bacillaceae bacterium IKA-2]